MGTPERSDSPVSQEEGEGGATVSAVHSTKYGRLTQAVASTSVHTDPKKIAGDLRKVGIETPEQLADVRATGVLPPNPEAVKKREERAKQLTPPTPPAPPPSSLADEWRGSPNLRLLVLACAGISLVAVVIAVAIAVFKR